ncbi:MAG: metallophosphoesterase family protein [Cellulosilyticaceae bacterium]
MKVLVISDTHGRIERVGYLINMLKPYGLTHVLHAGDCITDTLELQKKYPHLVIEGVPGNCDFRDYGIERHRLVEVDGLPIFLTHGDKHHVKYEYDELYIDAVAHEAKIAIFGHTHSAFKEKREGVLLLNPGSLTQPRDTTYPSFAILEIENGMLKSAEIKLLQRVDQISSHPYF